MLNKKVLLLAPLPPPVGGIASWAKMLLAKFPDPENLVHYNMALKFRSITDNRLFSRAVYGFMQLICNTCGIIWKLRDRKIKIIHICTSGHLGFLRDISIAFCGKIVGKKIIAHIRYGRLPRIMADRNWEYRLLKLLARSCNRIIVLDQASLDTMNDSGYQKAVKIPNYIDIDEIDDIVADPVSEADKSIIFVGHVIPAKGIAELLTAYEELSPAAPLRILGPYEAEYMNELQQRFSLRNVHFAGKATKEKVIKAIKQSKLFCLPSHTEGFPNVIAEAMACRVPIVATDVGAIREMLDADSPESCGICIPPRDSRALKEAMRKMLDNPEDADTAAERARKRVEAQYNFPAVCRRLIELWNEC